MARPTEQKRGPAPPGLPKSRPWFPPGWEIEDAGAIQALAYGRASEAQQRRAFAYIVETLCATYDMSFRPDELGGARATDFAEGKRFVGAQIVKLAKINLAAMRGKQTEQGEPAKPKEQ